MTTLDRAFIKAFALSTPGAVVPKTDETPRPPDAVETKAPPVSTPQFGPRSESDAAGLPDDSREEHSPPKPLSSFTSQPRPDDSFRALLEIDRAAWPETCGELLERASRDWDRFTEQLIVRMGQGQKCVALASIARGDGSTTVSLALAKHLAARGLRPVVVDVDPDHPTLVRSCGISVHTGWDDLLTSELALGEALISAVEDGVTLVPWRGPAMAVSKLAVSARASEIFATLREHYDLVLLDTMPLVGQTTIADFASLSDAIHLDALYLIHNVRTTTPEELIAASSKLRRAGLPLAAVIENFVSPTPPDDAADSTGFEDRKWTVTGDWRAE